MLAKVVHLLARVPLEFRENRLPYRYGRHHELLKPKNLKAALAVHFVCYRFCRVHQTLTDDSRDCGGGGGSGVGGLQNVSKPIIVWIPLDRIDTDW